MQTRIMCYLKNFWVQVILVATVGTTLGLQRQQHAQAEIDWQASHFRLVEKARYPLDRGFPFETQFFVDAEGARVEVPLPAGLELDTRDATWWSVEDSGRMHFWTEERTVVFPHVVEL